jgi:hypothetical protein
MHMDGPQTFRAQGFAKMQKNDGIAPAGKPDSKFGIGRQMVFQESRCALKKRGVPDFGQVRRFP